MNERETTFADHVDETEAHFEEDVSGPLEPNPAEPSPPKQPGQFLRFWRRLARYLLSLIFEFAGLAVWLVFAEALRNLLQRIYGDPRFFDRIPIRYVIDLGELVLLLTFFVVAVRKLWRDSNDD